MTTIHPELYPGSKPNHQPLNRVQRVVGTVVRALDRKLDLFFDAANLPPSPHVSQLLPPERLLQPDVTDRGVGEYMSSAGLVDLDTISDSEEVN